ncbi:MAG: hypothetical protein HFJ48_07735 [Clostridia bacterium]|nr:hypothetical protein [Clostridia bacterium]
MDNKKNDIILREKQIVRQRDSKIVKNQILETTLDTRIRQIEDILDTYENAKKDNNLK